MSLVLEADRFPETRKDKDFVIIKRVGGGKTFTEFVPSEQTLVTHDASIVQTYGPDIIDKPLDRAELSNFLTDSAHGPQTALNPRR